MLISKHSMESHRKDHNRQPASLIAFFADLRFQLYSTHRHHLLNIGQLIPGEEGQSGLAGPG